MKAAFPHGTAAGYNRHQTEGTLADIDRLACGCREAAARNRRRLRGGDPAVDYRRRLPAECGTASGYAAHQRNGTLDRIDLWGCGCRDAHNERMTEWRRQKGVKHRNPAVCGTWAGYAKHQREGTLADIDRLGCGCRNAARVYQQERKLRR